MIYLFSCLTQYCLNKQNDVPYSLDFILNLQFCYNIYFGISHKQNHTVSLFDFLIYSFHVYFNIAYINNIIPFLSLTVYLICSFLKKRKRGKWHNEKQASFVKESEAECSSSLFDTQNIRCNSCFNSGWIMLVILVKWDFWWYISRIPTRP